jgi:hypothetical protein
MSEYASALSKPRHVDELHRRPLHRFGDFLRINDSVAAFTALAAELGRLQDEARQRRAPGVAVGSHTKGERDENVRVHSTAPRIDYSQGHSVGGLVHIGPSLLTY